MDTLGVSHCRAMTPETASRLALALANCHLAMLGQRQHSCSQKSSLQECTNAFPDDRSFEAYMAQLSHIDRCAGIQILVGNAMKINVHAWHSKPQESKE